MRYSSSYLITFWLAIGWTLLGSQATADWPRFRGPRGDGQGVMTNPPLHFNHSEGWMWKTRIPGRGWSSPVVAKNQIWLTTAVVSSPRQEDLIRKATRNDLAEDKSISGPVQFRALQMDLQSGNILLDLLLAEIEEVDPIHALNSYASPTPALAQGKVICHFGTYGTWCLDHGTGEVLWTVRYPLDHSVGPGSSPVIIDSTVLLVCDGIDSQFIVGLDLHSGKELWKTLRPPIRSNNPEYRKAYCTPLVIEVETKRQAIIPGAQWIVAYDPQTGKEIWRVDHGEGFSTSPSPILESDRIIFSTGFTRPTLISLTPYAAGEIPLSSAQWQVSKGAPTVPSPLGYHGLIFSLSDAGVLTCIDAKTGEERGKRRIGGKFSASPLGIGNLIYLCSHDGKVTIVDADPNLDIRSVNDLGEQLMASPAVDKERLLVRGENHLFCFPSR